MPLTKQASSAVSALVALGFSQAEAEVYVALVHDSPATGYRIASAIGKATANTYKALRSLADKGAVMLQEGDGSHYVPMPADELLRGLTQTFKGQRDAATAALASLDRPSDDLGVYRLTEHPQVMQRAVAMLERAEEVAVITAFPAPLEALTPSIEAAAARGVNIGVKTYVPIAIRGVELFHSMEPEHWLQADIGEELVIVIDGQEHLLAFLDGDQVVQAIWTASPFLAGAAHNGVTLEHYATKLTTMIARGDSPDELRAQVGTIARSPVNTRGFRHQRELYRRRNSKVTKSEPKP